MERSISQTGNEHTDLPVEKMDIEQTIRDLIKDIPLACVLYDHGPTMELTKEDSLEPDQHWIYVPWIFEDLVMRRGIKHGNLKLGTIDTGGHNGYTDLLYSMILFEEGKMEDHIIDLYKKKEDMSFYDGYYEEQLRIFYDA